MKQEIEIKVPTNWAEVSLKRYQNYTKRVIGLENEDEIVLNTISALCDIPINVVKKLKVHDIVELYKKLSNLISLPINKQVFDKVKIKGKEFGFHPNLDEMSLGEFVDLEEHCKNGSEELQYILAILYRPIIENKNGKYDIEPYNENHIKNSPYFEELSIDVVNGVMVFFYNLGTEFLMSSSHYLKMKAEKKLQEVTMVGLV